VWLVVDENRARVDDASWSLRGARNKRCALPRRGVPCRAAPRRTGRGDLLADDRSSSNN